MRRFYRTIAAFIILTILSIGLWLSTIVYHIFHRPLLKPGKTATVKIYPNDHLQQIAARLVTANIIDSPHTFIWLVDFTDHRHHLRYGEYKVTDRMTLWQLLQNMLRGQGLVQHRVTLVDGWTFAQIRTELEHQTELTHTLKEGQDLNLMRQLNSTITQPEGWFYPDTYFYVWGNDDLSILQRAYEKMQEALSVAWKNRAPGLPYKTPYDALIAASLIERETNVLAEKPLVSSVISNRLKKKMRLQIDPTVQYGLGKSFGSTITKNDLKTKTPYNTYLIDGLPPTPICMPNRSSIEAALHPAKTDYLYYVATGDGGHTFSATYIEHKKAVKEYRRYEDQMQQDVNQLEVWFHQGVTMVSIGAAVMIYAPVFERSLGWV